MKKSYLRIAGMLLGVSLIFTACGDDVFEQPNVSAPSGVLPLANGATGQSVDFKVAVDPSLTASYTAVGTKVVVLNDSGVVEGNTITINFDAEKVAGAASILLTVTDSEGQSDEALAIFDIAQKDNVVIVTDDITENTTWTTGKVYVLAGRIPVLAGVTLTIQPGTIIKGQAGTGSNATALLVTRGAKLMAEGTPTAPIIFTSEADEIEPEDIVAGNFGSPNLAPDTDGRWGGVIILGKAKISASNDDGQLSEVQIEGIPTSDPNGLYGGNDDDDNSGVIKYISIRHGGANIGAGNEINGLTLGGIGRKTKIENVEVIANQDDGIEWFGGTVDVKNVVIWNVNDDGLDTDQSWSGTVDNFVIVTPAGHCFELDGPEGSYNASHTIKNGWVIANGGGRVSGDLINTDDNSRVTLENIFITGILSGQKINRVAHSEGEVNFTNIVLDIPSGALEDYVNGDVPPGVTAGQAPKVQDDINLDVFDWTWAKQAGKF